MISLKLIDLAKGIKVEHWYRLFVASIKWDRKSLEAYRNERLKKLIQHAYLNTKFYGKAMRERRVRPEHIKSARDLEKLAIVGRDNIRENVSSIVSRVGDVKKLFKGTSSGTTGTPITYYHDVNGISAGTAAKYVLCNMSGWKLGQPNIHIWGNAASINNWRRWSSKIKNALLRQYNIPSIWIDDPIIIGLVAKMIEKIDPVYIDGYPSAIFTLAQYFLENKRLLKNIRLVISTAENLEDHQRELIEKAFAPTADLYGSGEVLGIAARPAGDDRYYIFEPHVIVETIESGIAGMMDIVVTDLDNYVMPIIRYKIGDMIEGLHFPEDNAQYPFAYFKRLIGRSADIIQLKNGKRFHPINIFGGTLFREFQGITRHKVIWNGEYIKFLFEVKKPVPEAQIKSLLMKSTAEYGVPFMIEITNKISPSPNGKYIYFENTASTMKT